MGFDYEAGRLTANNHELQPAQMLPTVIGMQIGEVRYTRGTEVIADETGKTWIKARARAYDLNEVIQVGYHDNEVNFFRTICTADGIVVDKSHEEIKTWGEANRFRPINSELVKENPHDYLAVVYSAFNREEWELIFSALKERYRIIFEIEDLKPVVTEIQRLLQEARTEEYAGDDDEEEAA